MPIRIFPPGGKKTPQANQAPAAQPAPAAKAQEPAPIPKHVQAMQNFQKFTTNIGEQMKVKTTSFGNTLSVGSSMLGHQMHTGLKTSFGPTSEEIRNTIVLPGKPRPVFADLAYFPSLSFAKL